MPGALAAIDVQDREAEEVAAGSIEQHFGRQGKSAFGAWSLCAHLENALVSFQHVKPGGDVLRMIGAWLDLQPERATEKSGAEFSNDERHALSHQAGDEGNVAGEAVEFGDDDRTLAPTRD